MKKVVTFLLILIICIEVNAQSCKVFIGNSVDSINTIVSKIEIAIHSKFINKTKNNNGYSFSDDKGNELQINGEDEIEKVIVNCADAKIRVAFYNLLKQQASTCPNY
ncbi:hypothetical protein E3E36_11635, partial [Thermococcus sp. M36]|uniref:hypothetical protein n=1 Tax=Thermococcus sp. M36 TaxID=1638261 RepID=UPI001439C129